MANAVAWSGSEEVRRTESTQNGRLLAIVGIDQFFNYLALSDANLEDIDG